MQATTGHDDELLQQAAAGDEAAFDILIRPHLLPAYRLAVTILGDPGAAEDAVQESAFKAWRHLGRLRQGTTIRPWFLTVVANQCRSERRSRWWRVLRGLDRPGVESPDVDLTGWDLRRALLRLGPGDRAALFLRYYEDLPLADVAAVLRVSVPAARSRIQRALARMRPQLEVEGYEA
jgi:RNA polymerase sigma factor (sigma-70 family)